MRATLAPERVWPVTWLPMAVAFMCACPHAASPQRVSPFLVTGWSEEEAAAFEAGLDAHGRRFDLLHAHMLPHRSVRELVSFFYDVWKTRSTQRARAWHARKKEVRTFVVCWQCRAGQVSAITWPARDSVRLPPAAGLKPGACAGRRCAACLSMLPSRDGSKHMAQVQGPRCLAE